VHHRHLPVRPRVDVQGPVLEGLAQGPFADEKVSQSGGILESHVSFLLCMKIKKARKGVPPGPLLNAESASRTGLFPIYLLGKPM